MLSKRVQVLMDEKEYKQLSRLGKQSHKSVGEIFREAARLYRGRLIIRGARLSVVKKMKKLKAPVSHWGKMEQEIIRARIK